MLLKEAEGVEPEPRISLTRQGVTGRMGQSHHPSLGMGGRLGYSRFQEIPSHESI